MKKFTGKSFNFIQINIILVFLFLSLFSSTQPAFSFTKNNSNVANTAACQHVGMLLPKNPSLSSLNLSGLNYDEQVGETFTQSFTSMAYVTAVAQVNSDGIGPAYLLNGLSDKGYWYQVGLSYNWAHYT